MRDDVLSCRVAVLTKDHSDISHYETMRGLRAWLCNVGRDVVRYSWERHMWTGGVRRAKSGGWAYYHRQYRLGRMLTVLGAWIIRRGLGEDRLLCVEVVP